MTEEAKKAITEADAILWLASDPCSLALLLLHKEFTKTIKESKSQITLVCRSRFSFREQFILQLLEIKPTLAGIAELGSGIVDKLVLEPEDASEITDLRSKGFNVVMEDIEKIKDKKDLSSILKGMGISLKDISMEIGDLDKKGTLEDLVTQLSFSKSEEAPSEESKEEDEDIVIELKESVQVDETSPLDLINQKPVKLQDTEPRNYDFSDPSLKLTQEMVESLMKELSSDVPSEEQESTVVIENETLLSPPVNEEKIEISIQFESQEAFTEAIQAFLKEGSKENRDLIQGIGDAIAKNADMATYAAKKLTSALETQSDLPHLIPA